MILAILAAAVVATGPTQSQLNQALANATSTQEMALAKGQNTAVLLSSSAVGQSDACLVVNSLSVGTLMVSGNVNVSRLDVNCGRIRKAKMLVELQLPEAATQVMCLDGDVKRAMADAGTPCASIRRPVDAR